MVAAIGSGIGNFGVSLARRGHGDASGQPHQPSTDHSGHNRPVGGSDGQNRPVGRNDRVEGPTISGDGSQDMTEAFEEVIRSVALTVFNDAMADAEEAMADTEEDA